MGEGPSVLRGSRSEFSLQAALSPRRHAQSIATVEPREDRGAQAMPDSRDSETRSFLTVQILLFYSKFCY